MWRSRSESPKTTFIFDESLLNLLSILVLWHTDRTGIIHPAAWFSRFSREKIRFPWKMDLTHCNWICYPTSSNKKQNFQIFSRGHFFKLFFLPWENCHFCPHKTAQKRIFFLRFSHEGIFSHFFRSREKILTPPFSLISSQNCTFLSIFPHKWASTCCEFSPLVRKFWVV